LIPGHTVGAEVGSIRAGFGRADITPKIGVELAGFGPFLNRRCTRIFERIFARAIAVDSASGRWVLVSCDLLAVSADVTAQVRALIAAATGWRAHEIAVHATHSHSGPSATPEFIGWGEPDPVYVELLPRRIAAACIDAINDLAPALFSHAEVASDGFGYNRMLPSPGRSNRAVLAGHWHTSRPEDTDTTAHVIRVDRAGRLSGFLAYFSCHPVICCQRTREIHGDFVGVAVNRVERMYPGSVGLFLQGAEGDIDTAYAHGPAAESLGALDRFAGRFAEVIVDGVTRATRIDVTHVSSRSSEAHYTLGPIEEEDLRRRYELCSRQAQDATLGAQTDEQRLALVYVLSLRQTLSRLRNGEPIHRPVTIQALSLGPVTLTATNLEVFHRIKRRFQAEFGSRALLLSVTNGYLGYAPSRDAYHAPMPTYPAYEVPYYIGYLPFTDAFEDELLDALRVSQQQLASETPRLEPAS
jgi:Neutral/alkaline non-lysosomal ceramidase, N-terminal